MSGGWVHRTLFGEGDAMILAETAFAPCRRIAGHGHEVWHLCAVLSGGFEEIEEGGVRLVEAGGYRVSRPKASHDLNVHEDGAHCVILEAYGNFWPRVFARQLGRGQSNRFMKTGAGDLRRAAEVFINPSHLRVQEMQNACAALFTPQGDCRTSAVVEDAKGMIVQSNGALSISRYAERSRMHRGVFARMFRDALGLTPAEFRKLQRLKYAVGRVVEEGAPLAEAAADAGYADQSHMTHDFTAILGATPAALRRTARAAA